MILLTQDADDGDQNTLNTFTGSKHSNDNNWKVINKTEYSMNKQTESEQ
jgi:hypothetical protein